MGCRDISGGKWTRSGKHTDLPGMPREIKIPVRRVGLLDPFFSVFGKMKRRGWIQCRNREEEDADVEDGVEGAGGTCRCDSVWGGGA